MSATTNIPAVTISPRIRKSPFFDGTIAAGAASFTVYNHMYMPTSYGDPAAEYHRLLHGVSMWDVAAERQVEIVGPDAEKLVRYLTPRNLGACEIGKGRYIPLCDHHGRLINDPVMLRLEDDLFWLSIADSDVILWVRAVAAERGYDCEVSEPDVSPLAIQGPKAEDVVADLLGEWVREIKYFGFQQTSLKHIPLVVARSGWSKQGGFELYLRDGDFGMELWDAVREAGSKYGIGPGTPNHVERIESGLLSYGADHDRDADPFELGLGKLVDLTRDDEFIGKEALKRRAEGGARRKLVGFAFDGEPFVANQHPLELEAEDGAPAGTLRAACFSVRRKENVGVAFVPVACAGIGTALRFHSGGHVYTGRVVDMPLVKPGS